MKHNSWTYRITHHTLLQMVAVSVILLSLPLLMQAVEGNGSAKISLAARQSALMIDHARNLLGTWDTNADGAADAWDSDGDGQPDAFKVQRKRAGD